MARRDSALELKPEAALECFACPRRLDDDALCGESTGTGHITPGGGGKVGNFINFSRTVFATWVLTKALLSTGAAVDKVPASYNPPGGLSASKVPQFVCLGWDDNGLSDGMTWILDELKRRKNPAGRGNLATFDAENEIRRCDSILESLGIPKSEIPGFRTPQLAIVIDVFNAVYKRGFQYDCTVENHTGIAEGRFVSPYTLENGWHESAFGALHLSFPGMWELPVQQFANGTTGFDYNAWTSDASGGVFFNTLKSSLDFHMSTNRSPFFIGTHSDYYANYNTSFDGQAKANLAERRKAIVDFIEYALSKPDVRIVRMIDVIHWMRNPVALDAQVLVRSRALPLPGSYDAMELSRNNVVLSIPRDGFNSFNRYLANGRKTVVSFPVPSDQIRPRFRPGP